MNAILAATRAALAALMLAAALPALAETSAVSAGGFLVTVERRVEAPVDVLWRAITQLPQWWNGRHTWSGNAANLSLDLRPGGCWCESWDGGGVMHGSVVHVAAGKLLRFNATLGPLQDRAVNGVLTLASGTRDGKTALKVVYRVAGPTDVGLAELAPAVDQVITEQVNRLAALAERGKAE